MKKRSLNSLKLNKESISNLGIKGGLPPTTTRPQGTINRSDCICMISDNDCHTGLTDFGGVCSHCER